MRSPRATTYIMVSTWEPKRWPLAIVVDCETERVRERAESVEVMESSRITEEYKTNREAGFGRCLSLTDLLS